MANEEELVKVLANPNDQGIVVRVFEDERPLLGLAGLLDWEFRGALSKFILSGFIQGRSNEKVILPLRRGNHSITLLLWGSGKTPHPGFRNRVEPAQYLKIKTQASNLKTIKWWLSKEDFGNPGKLDSEGDAWTIGN